MNPDFQAAGINSLSYIYYPPWKAAGIKHGFIGKTASGRDLPALKELFCKSWRVPTLLLLHQVHGDHVLDLRKSSALTEFDPISRKGKPYPPEFQADAVLINTDLTSEHYAIGILTADCLPLLIRQGSTFALVHAGWRGLANGIIPRVLALLKENDQPEQTEVLIGPSAGAERYEVGEEVIEAIGEHAIYRPAPPKFLLSLEATAQKQLEHASKSLLQITSTGLCTISEHGFNSYRREGAATGHNLSFLIP